MLACLIIPLNTILHLLNGSKRVRVSPRPVRKESPEAEGERKKWSPPPSPSSSSSSEEEEGDSRE